MVPRISGIARFAPAIGGAVLDGSLTGWESCEPVRFQADDKQTVEVLRSMIRKTCICAGTPACLPGSTRNHWRRSSALSHGRMADTLSFYIQGDLNAKPNCPADGRPGDVRIVFGVFKDNATLRPVALGMFPAWQGTGKPAPQGYQSPVGRVEFAHVGPVAARH